MRKRSGFFAMTLFAVTWSFVSVASAQPTSRPLTPSEEADAVSRRQAIYTRSLRLMSKEQWGDAREGLRYLWLESRDRNIAAALGKCEFALSNFTQAAEYLHWALDHAVLQDGNLDQLQAAFQRARSHVGLVAWSSEPREAQLLINGTAVSVINPGKLFLMPGRYRATATHPGMESHDTEFVVTASGSLSLDFVLKPALPAPISLQKADEQRSAATNQNPTDENASSGWPLWIGIAGVAMSAGLIGGGVYFVTDANAVSNQRESELGELKRATKSQYPCGGGIQPVPAACENLYRLSDQQGRSRNTATALFVSGGVLTLGTAAYFVFRPKGDKKTIAITPGVSPESISLTAFGRF